MDIYQVVAEELARYVAAFANEGDEIAQEWNGIIDRKLVKAGTMTTPYGVTEDGIRQQLLDAARERFPDQFRSRGKAVAFLGPLLMTSIDSVVVKAGELTKWLRDVVLALAGKGLGLHWTVPTGFRVIHCYRPEKGRRVRTVMGAVVLVERDATQPTIDVEKQSNAIVPNLVHSLDAAHMMATVNALRKRGLSDFAMVHDSYAVHACDVDVMNEVLRNEFIGIHRVFTPATLHAQIAAQANGSEIPAPPVAGELDLDAVRRADYFFS
jgi:DNA-directed RNA polymerase